MSTKSIQICIRVTEGQLKSLKAAAAVDGQRSVSSLIRLILSRELTKIAPTRR